MVFTNLTAFPVGGLNMEALESRGTEYGDVPAQKYHGTYSDVQKCQTEGFDLQISFGLTKN